MPLFRVLEESESKDEDYIDSVYEKVYEKRRQLDAEALRKQKLRKPKRYKRIFLDDYLITATRPMLGIKCTRHSYCQVKCSHWQYKFPLPVKIVATARRLEMPLPKVFTDIEEKKKKLPVKDR
nr:hypothetical protein [Tanacetum cinerariifolium]